MIIIEEDFTQIYKQYFSIMCRFLNYYTHDVHAIEEVVQDVFIELWSDRQKKEIKHIKTYLYKSARNRMLNYLRSVENRNIVLEKWARIELDQQKSVDCIAREDFILLLQAAVDALPPKCKEIYILSREEQLSYKEIAGMQNLSVKTVEVQMGIALRKIREYIIHHSGNPELIILLLLFFENN